MSWPEFETLNYLVTVACAELAICLILAAETLYIELRGS